MRIVTSCSYDHRRQQQSEQREGIRGAVGGVRGWAMRPGSANMFTVGRPGGKGRPKWMPCGLSDWGGGRTDGGFHWHMCHDVSGEVSAAGALWPYAVHVKLADGDGFSQWRDVRKQTRLDTQTTPPNQHSSAHPAGNTTQKD